MAQKKLTAREIGDDGEAIEANFEDRSQIQSDIDAEENEFAQAFGADTDDVKYWFEVRRVLKNSKQKPKLFVGTRADLPSLDQRLIDYYGTGDYEIRVWKEEGGKNILHRRFTHSVEAPRVGSVQAIVPSESPAVLQSIQNQQETLRVLLERTNQQPQQAQRMSATEIAAIITAAATVLPALKSFMQSPAAPATNPMELVQTVLELVQNVEGSGRERGTMDLIGDLLKSPLMEKLAEGFQAPQQTRVVQPQLPNPQNYSVPMPAPLSAPVRQAAPMSQPPVNQAEAQLRSQLQLLVSRARKNSDPELYAEVMADMDELHPFLPLLLSPGALPALIQIEPSIGQHVDWFMELLASLTEIVQAARNEAASGAPMQGAHHVSGLHAPAFDPNGNAGGESGSLDDAQGDAGLGAF